MHDLRNLGTSTPQVLLRRDHDLFSDLPRMVDNDLRWVLDTAEKTGYWSNTLNRDWTFSVKKLMLMDVQPKYSARCTKWLDKRTMSLLEHHAR